MTDSPTTLLTPPASDDPPEAAAPADETSATVVDRLRQRQRRLKAPPNNAIPMAKTPQRATSTMMGVRNILEVQHAATAPLLRVVEAQCKMFTVPLLEALQPHVNLAASAALAAARTQVTQQIPGGIFDTAAARAADSVHSATRALSTAMLATSAAQDSIATTMLASSAAATCDWLIAPGLLNCMSRFEAAAESWRVKWAEPNILSVLGSFAANRVGQTWRAALGLDHWARSVIGPPLALNPQIAEMFSSVGRAVLDFDAFRRAAEGIARTAKALAERLYLAVITAQGAALRGDRDAVEQFFITWTTLPRRSWNARIQAGTDVLLFTNVEDYGPDTAFDLLDHIEKATNRLLCRGRRLLADTELNHARMAAIEELPSLVGPERALGLLPSAPAAEDRALIVLNQVADDRLETLLAGLTPDEERVALAYRFTKSWQDAALLCGRHPREGERVRAKLTARAKRIIVMDGRSAYRPRR